LCCTIKLIPLAFEESLSNALMDKLDIVIQAYDHLMNGIEADAQLERNDRAYGGIIRSGKGLLVESITETILRYAWEDLGGHPSRINFEKEIRKLKVRETYIRNSSNSFLKSDYQQYPNKYFYRLKADVHCNIDNNLALAIECKTYTENAMLKRILVDFTLIKTAWPNVDCFLLQLESQLGGDYSELKNYQRIGSASTNTLISYFDIDLKILTLLEGERKINKPIHKPMYFKPLTRESLLLAVKEFQKSLKPHL
jgi:hypothetical protein